MDIFEPEIMKRLASALVIALGLAQMSFAEPMTDSTPSPTVMPKVKREVAEPIVPEKPPVDEGDYSDKTLKNAFFLFQLQEELKDAKNSYRGLNSIAGEAQRKLEKTQESIFTLKEQISLFQNTINESEKKILNVVQQIADKEQEITKLDSETGARKMAIADQKKLLEQYMRMQYVQENLYFENGELSSAKVLLADQPVSDTFDQVHAVSLFQETGGQMLDQLASDTRMLEGMQLSMEGKKKRLDQLRERLQAEQDGLNDQKLAKAQLLKDTRGDEERYRELIAESAKQQEESILEIRALQDNMRYVQRKLQDFGSNISFGELKNLVDQRTKEFYDYQLSSDPNAVFQWPVQPNRGISAYFRDPSYRARFGVGHNAVDIPTSQGTPVRAARDGYVYKVKDNGMGYSYIILSHQDQYTTVYGHLSEMLVNENDFVKAGTIIAMSGGTPGTKGAGHMTTGAHLHFEILKKGAYVDPLDYLSLTRLSLESLPERYADRIEKEKKEVAEESSESATVSEEELLKIIEDSAKRELEESEEGE